MQGCRDAADPDVRPQHLDVGGGLARLVPDSHFASVELDVRLVVKVVL